MAIETVHVIQFINTLHDEYFIILENAIDIHDYYRIIEWYLIRNGRRGADVGHVSLTKHVILER